MHGLPWLRSLLSVYLGARSRPAACIVEMRRSGSVCGWAAMHQRTRMHMARASCGSGLGVATIVLGWVDKGRLIYEGS